MGARYAALCVLLTTTPVLAGDLGTFARSLNATPHGYRVVEDPTGLAPTPQVERFEVRPGECGRNRGWDDCATDRERSELGQVRGSRIAVSTEDSEAWYGWFFYLPPRHPNVHPTKAVFGQFHQTGSHPVFMFRQTGAGLILDNQIDKTRSDLLIPDEDLRGHWHRLEIHARWSRAPDGFFRVYVDGVQRSDYAGVTASADEIYLKYGVYRSFVSRYKAAKNVAEVPGQIAFFADLQSAQTREGLVDAPQ